MKTEINTLQERLRRYRETRAELLDAKASCEARGATPDPWLGTTAQTVEANILAVEKQLHRLAKLERVLPDPAHRPTDLEIGPGVVLLHFPGDPEGDPVAIESDKLGRFGHCRISIMNQAGLLLPRLTSCVWIATVIGPLLKDARAQGQRLDPPAESLLRETATPFPTQ